MVENVWSFELKPDCLIQCGLLKPGAMLCSTLPVRARSQWWVSPFLSQPEVHDEFLTSCQSQKSVMSSSLPARTRSPWWVPHFLSESEQEFNFEIQNKSSSLSSDSRFQKSLKKFDPPPPQCLSDSVFLASVVRLRRVSGNHQAYPDLSRSFQSGSLVSGNWLDFGSGLCTQNKTPKVQLVSSALSWLYMYAVKKLKSFLQKLFCDQYAAFHRANWRHQPLLKLMLNVGPGWDVWCVYPPPPCLEHRPRLVITTWGSSLAVTWSTFLPDWPGVFDACAV